MNITSFLPKCAEAPGCVGFTEVRIRQFLPREIKDELPTISLGRPAVHGDTVLVGTDNPVTDSAYLFCLNGSTMMTSMRSDPVLSYSRVNEHVRDVHWISETSAVCATGEGCMQLFHVNRSEQHAITHLASISNIHSKHIRELAVKGGGDGTIASGGFDSDLCITQLSSGSSQLLQRVCFPESVISSVKWPSFNSNVCVSCTTEDGAYALFDTREAMRKPALQASPGKKDLFTHCRLSDHYALLGYGDGEMKYFDMRRPTDCLSTVDPYVEGIGSIDWNPESSLLLISGYTDCSVWKITNGCASIWSHMVPGPNALSNNDGFSTNAVFWSTSITLTTDNSGSLHLFLQIE